MKMKVEIRRKSPGYWQVWENVEKELSELIKMNNGEFPNRKILEKHYSPIYNAVKRHHGGFPRVMVKMGFIERKRNKYWEDWNNFEKELKMVIEKNNGNFPTRSYLKDNGLGKISAAIYKYHGGVNTVKLKLGYTIETKPDKYWFDKKNIIYEFEQVVKLNKGQVPIHKRLFEMGFSSLASAIIKEYGNFPLFLKEAGYTSKRKARGYWKEEENIKNELEGVIKILGHFPTQKELAKIKNQQLASAISRHRLKLTGFRQKMGYGQLRKPNGYYSDWNRFEKDMQKAIYENNGKFPTPKRLVDMNYGYLENPAHKYHGGFPAVREKIGYNELMRRELARGLEEIAERLVG